MHGAHEILWPECTGCVSLFTVESALNPALDQNTNAVQESAVEFSRGGRNEHQRSSSRHLRKWPGRDGWGSTNS